MAKGLTKGECAQILTALCRRRLIEAGYPIAAFGINESDVLTALEERVGLTPVIPEVPEFVETPEVSRSAGVASNAVLEVWGAWQVLMGMAELLDVKSWTKIEERLAFGFTTAELIKACEVAVADPSLLKRTKVRSIARPLESDRRVCSLIGKLYVRPAKVTWLTPFEELWLRYFPDGEVPHGVMARCLSGLVTKHGGERVLEEADRYLETTALPYVSWPKFAQGFGTWTYGAKLTNSRSSYARDAVSGL